MNSFVQRIASTIANGHLLHAEGTYLTALSGGADSVALLRVLLQLGYHVEAVHCNFKLRGAESDRDEQFCVTLCEQLDIPLHRAHFDTRTYAEHHKVSLEMAARDLRYAYFEQLRRDMGGDDICVAHHRDDNVETLLINLLRGTGIRGLCGMAPRHGHIVRPLLGVGREDILKYLDSLGQSYVTDSTNLQPDAALRNQIRLHVLPLLERITPACRTSIARTEQRLGEAFRVYEAAIEASAAEVMPEGDTRIDIDRLRTQPSPESTLFHIVRRYGFTPTQVEEIAAGLDSNSGRQWISESHELLIDRRHILIRPRKAQPKGPFLIPEDGNYVYEGTRLSVTTTTFCTVGAINRDPTHATLDASQIHFPLTLRHTRDGDRFCPFGMNGSRLISDLLTDLKLSRFEKRDQLVLTDATGRILWVVGRRCDNRFRVNANTQRVLLCHVTKVER